MKGIGWIEITTGSKSNVIAFTKIKYSSGREYYWGSNGRDVDAYISVFFITALPVACSIGYPSELGVRSGEGDQCSAEQTTGVGCCADEILPLGSRPSLPLVGDTGGRAISSKRSICS
jgi:hypothetical protein